MSRVTKTMDGNNAAAWVSYAFSEVAAIYPITPSSVMAEVTDEWAAKGRKNIFNQEVKVVEMQSESGASGTVHGSLQSGALTTTYTASQGLLMMIPNLYKMAGELLPAVLHVSARALATHALSIFGDHSDVMACRQTGLALLASNNAQEVMDLGAISHLCAIKGRVPFLHFFDGFRTSHELLKIETWDYETLKGLVDYDALNAFRKRALNPERPVIRGTNQNPDVFFQASEAANKFYDAIPGIVLDYMDKVNKLTGRDYSLFNYYGDPQAEHIIIAMGSVCDTTEDVIDYLMKKGEKVGLLKVRLYRPFSVKHFLGAIPKTVKKIAVLDRTKEPGAIGEPLYQDVCTAYLNEENKPLIVGGRYGLGSKDTTPAHIISVYENLKSDRPKNGFTISIIDDVTNLSLPISAEPDTTPEGTVSCKFWGLGSDGTVGANKNSIKIIGDHTDLYAQAYFAYDSKKSGGITTSHLRFGKKQIKSSYLVTSADFVACHNQSYIQKYDIVNEVKPGGTFLLNTLWTQNELDEKLPDKVKAYLAKNNINFYIVDGVTIARDLGLGNRVNMVLQAAFFKLAKIIDIDDAVKYMKQAVVETYGAKGDNIVKMNHDAIDKGISSIVKVEIPKSWDGATTKAKAEDGDSSEFIKNIFNPMNELKGDLIPVSAFAGREDGTFEMGTAALEKRGVAVEVPQWYEENCIQCNLCSLVCPHAAIRPAVYDKDEAKAAPGQTKFADKMIGKGFEDYKFSIVVSPLDCMGCGSCANVCPGKKGEKALKLQPIDTQKGQQDVFDYAVSKLSDKDLGTAKNTTKGSQFIRPLLEFSGACAGCGETPYAKLTTQLFGDRMYIANATGCSSIWGAAAPSMPYTKNKDGHGPAWANSLFEDNAEYGLGMHVGNEQIRQRLMGRAQQLLDLGVNDECRGVIQNWLDARDDIENSKPATIKLVEMLKTCKPEDAQKKEIIDELLDNKEFLAKKAVWIIGGDGWAYDIGFGGLDHVIASGQDINILVLDTEVYSNTGGQSSKSTPLGAVAQFAAAGRSGNKKDMAAIAMSYGNVYVAQIAMGADYNQCVKALYEAGTYKGPSIVIAYSPCILHGVKKGMGFSQGNMKDAVESGYWHLFRFDPRRKDRGENPFVLDSKKPTASFIDFLESQVRYKTLTRTFPQRAKELFENAEKFSKEKYERLVRLAEQK